MQLIVEPAAQCLQSLLISIATFVGTKDFSVNLASHKCIFRVNSPPFLKGVTGDY